MSTMLTAKQVADMLGLSRSKVYDLANSSKLPSYRFDGALRFEEADVVAFKAACRAAPLTMPRVKQPLQTTTLKASDPNRESELSKYFRARGLKSRGQRRSG
jgi:excisionase family DNA binding protein